MNRRALLIALAAGVVGFVLLVLYQQRFEREASGGHTVQVLYAVQDIDLGESVSDTKLGARDVPEAFVDERNIRRADLRRVVGVRVSMAVRAGQTLLWTDLATRSDARRDLSSLVHSGMRAVTVRADATSTFSGLVRPGDRVDVLATMPRPRAGNPAMGLNENDRVTLPLLQNVLVLAAGRDTGGERITPRAGASSAPGMNNTEQVTLSATLDEAALLVFAQDRGRLSLVLRNPDDLAVIERLPETSLANVLQSSGRVHGALAPPLVPEPAARESDTAPVAPAAP